MLKEIKNVFKFLIALIVQKNYEDKKWKEIIKR